MPSYTYKNEVDLAFDANKKRLRCEGAILLQQVLNEALHEMSEQFNAGLAEGEILEIGGTREEMRQLLLAAANRKLALNASSDED
jgi:hypothetical protein